MSEERAIYHIAPKEPAPPRQKSAQETIKEITQRATDNLIWLLGQVDDDQAKEIVEAIINARPALAREIIENMDNVQGS